MIRSIFIGIAAFIWATACTTTSGPETYTQQVISLRKEKNKEMAGSKSPLLDSDRKNFAGLNYFPVDSVFRVYAAVLLDDTSSPFQMPTSTDRLPTYRRAALLRFEFERMPLELSAFLNVDNPEDSTLFVPFTDLTSGEESYGGGRYLDLNWNGTDSVELDFNMAYNPYCAYNYNYSCPIPPRENDLKLAIRAGEKVFKEDH